jgi:hypothetical protein
MTLSGDALRMGSAHHVAALEPEIWDSEFVVVTEDIQEELYQEALDTGSKAKGFSRALKTYSSWAASQTAAGKQILTLAEHAQIKAMQAGLLLDPEVAAYFLSHSRRDLEVSILYSWPCGNGRYITSKNRLDLVGNGRVSDLKTTRSSGAPDDFARTVHNYHYDEQLAFYGEGWAFASGETVDGITFLPTPKESPYCASVYHMPDCWRRYAAMKVHGSIMKLAACIESGKFPGHGVQELVPPYYVAKEIEGAIG